MTNHASGPLTGLRVLDLGTMIAGPFAATLLADFGAEVIKVELPGRGDTLRHLGPVGDGSSFWFSADARNKKSVTLDLRTASGQDLLLRLVPHADALVENFVPGTLDGWGLTGDRLRAANPRLIIARASGFGQTGPYRSRPGYDRVGAAFSGLWHITGHPDGAPVRTGTSMTDYLTGTMGAFGLMVALYHRDQHGGPAQEIDASLFESDFRTMEYTAIHYGRDGMVRGRVGNAGPAVPSGAFQTRDGRWITLAVAEDKMYARLMRAIGRTDLAEDERYIHAPGRTADRLPIEAAVAAWVAGQTLEQAQQLLAGADIAAGAGYTIADCFADPHYAAREAIVEIDDPTFGPIWMQGVTPKLSHTPGSIRRGGPRLGEHNVDVLGGLLGLSSEELDRLRGERVI